MEEISDNDIFESIAKDTSGDGVKITLFYSTDGKNTIQIEGVNNSNLAHYDKVGRDWYNSVVQDFGKKGATPDMKRDYGGNTFAASLDGDVCPMHNQPMKQGKSGKFYHSDGSGNFCFGTGWKRFDK